MLKLIGRLAEGIFNLAALVCLFPFAYAATLLPGAGADFLKWYDAMAVGSWKKFIGVERRI